MYREQGQIKKLSSKAKRQVQKRFPIMWILKKECKFLNSAIKFQVLKLKIEVNNLKFKAWISAGIVRHR